MHNVYAYVDVQRVPPPYHSSSVTLLPLVGEILEVGVGGCRSLAFVFTQFGYMLKRRLCGSLFTQSCGSELGQCVSSCLL